MKKSILGLLLLFHINVFSQQYYQFVQSTDPYVELSNDSIITTPRFDDDLLTVISLNQLTFNFFGNDFLFDNDAYFAIQTNGNLRIEDDSLAVIIDGLFTDLDSIDLNTKLSWKVTGPPGDKLVKVQWKHVQLASGVPGNFANFQIWVYQQTGIIEFRYGERSNSNASGFGGNGPNVGAFYANNTFTQLLEKLWISNDPASPTLDTNQVFFFPKLTGVPEEGTVYRLIPRHLTAGLESKVNQTNIHVFPNPVSDQLILDIGENNSIKDIQIIDTNGKVIQEELFNLSEEKLDVSNLINGTYVIHLNTKTGQMKQKIVVSH